ncbi:DNA ligase D [Acidobacteria bacterium AH-259-D05]|nr:DNA ligase D [Acidobacteria bacterium AH-259-D05]
MGLERYRRKRDFHKTREPSGERPRTSEQRFRFVVQKHQARRLHYDFRLEIEGVLRSWAVPKGPSLDPSEKRLAIQVEDHPLEYGDFEGVIPAGQYGAGKVIVWDQGTFQCLGRETDPLKAWNKGKLDLQLDGQKLRGMWLLIRLKTSEKNQWLLFKKDDKYADAESEITQVAPESVISGREVEEVQEGDSPTWNSRVNRLLEELQIQPRELQGQVKPMLATLASEVPEGAHWSYELKYDGVRALAVKDKDQFQLYPRNLKPLDRQFPEVFEELKEIQCKSFCLDGEIVTLDEKGRSRFHLLQKRMGRADISAVAELMEEVPVYYFVFDLIFCEGYDLRGVTLAERKKILQAVVPRGSFIRYTESVSSQGREFLGLAREQGLEGIMAKDMTSTYRSQRSREWLKIKCHHQREFVIVGYTPPSGSRRYFGALLLGLFENGKLVYVGKAGSGFDETTLKQLHGELKTRKLPKNPFSSVPKGLKVEAWVEPDLVCQVRFSEWTQKGYLRAPVFVGLRPHRNPRECTREIAEEEIQNRRFSYDFTSNLNKIFWPKEGYTKGDLIRFYHEIADVLVPHLTDRPMVLERFPDGVEGESFYQKNAPDFLPGWIPTVEVESDSAEKTIRYILCNDRQTLVYLANLGCISQHPWSSRFHQLDNPDFLIIDLDPSEGVPFALVTQVALKVRQVVESLELKTYPKTSGATGVHIIIPLEPLYSNDDVRNLAEIIARLTVDGLEEIATIERSRAKRKNKVYVDYLQNGRGKTVVSPYCLRPLPGAPVSTPLEWSEVGPQLRPDSFNLKTIFRRLDTKGELFEGVRRDLQSLHNALEKLEQLWNDARHYDGNAG